MVLEPFLQFSDKIIKSINVSIKLVINESFVGMLS